MAQEHDQASPPDMASLVDEMAGLWQRVGDLEDDHANALVASRRLKKRVKKLKRRLKASELNVSYLAAEFLQDLVGKVCEHDQRLDAAGAPGPGEAAISRRREPAAEMG